MIIISVVKGEQSGQRFECDEEVITLGRGPSNRITVEDPVVSWQHGQITLHDGQYIYRDLNSTNGSLIARGSRRWKLDRVVPEMTLEPGDKIMLGSTVLEASIAAPSVLRMFTTKALRPQRPGLPTAEVAEIEGIYNSLRSDRETLLAIYEMERRIHLELDPERIRDRVLEAVLTAFPNASSVSLATVEPGLATMPPQRLTLDEASRPSPEGAAPPAPSPPGPGDKSSEGPAPASTAVPHPEPGN